MSDSSVPPLTQYLDDLYMLARVLAGPDRAEGLVADAYQEALRSSPDERPDNQRAWLLRHLLDLHTARRAQQEGSAALADEFRQEAAESIAARAMPVAFAACATQERLILTLDVQAEQSDSALRDVLDRVADADRDLRAEAWAALRASLRDTLTGPERMLIDVALSEAALREALAAMLADHMRTAPAPLRREVATLIREANTPAEADTDETRAGEAATGRVWRRAVGVVFLIVVLGAGGYGLYWSLSPTPTPDPDLVTFTARRVESVRPDLSTDDPVTAEKYIQTQWGRRLTVPVIDGAAITGIGTLQAGSVAIPVVLYADSTTGHAVRVAAYTYALLDQLEERAPVSTSLRDQLAEEGVLIPRETTEETALLWRRRDDIFIATAPAIPPAALLERVRP